MEKEKIFEKKISFVDAEDNIVGCEIGIKQTSKGPEFTMSGSQGGGCGQIFDHVKPRTESQKTLIGYWEKYHLNDMNAGTVEQELILKGCKSDDYTRRVDFLKRRHKYTVVLPDGTRYKYGSGWLYRSLPNDFKNKLLELIMKIEIENQEYKQSKIDGSDVKSFDEFDNEIVALAQHLGLTPQEAEDIEDYSDNRYSYQGIEYLIGTEEEIESIAMEYLTDDPSLWQESVGAGGTTSGLDEWAEEVVNIDGCGSILNHWDGSEDTERVNDVWYHIIRQ